MTALNLTIRLRPSVAFVPLRDGTYQFFMGNTRRSRVFKMEPALAWFVAKLNGDQTVLETAAAAEITADRAMAFAQELLDSCLAEDVEFAARIALSPCRRVLNFLGDYFPWNEVEPSFDRISNTPIVLLGAGAVGSWIAVQLVRTGFSRFCLVDPDVVERSNLNRSLYEESDIGRLKVVALAEKLERVTPEASVRAMPVRLESAEDMLGILVGCEGRPIVVNCADEPSVDVTSSLVNDACQRHDTPYIIAGGYNLHLSLVGLTVLPGRTACYRCSAITLSELQGQELDNVRKLVRPWRNIGNLSPLAAITASFAVNEILRVAVDSDKLKPAMINRRGEFNFLTNQLHFTALPPREECGCVRPLAGMASD